MRRSSPRSRTRRRLCRIAANALSIATRRQGDDEHGLRAPEVAAAAAATTRRRDAGATRRSVAVEDDEARVADERLKERRKKKKIKDTLSTSHSLSDAHLDPRQESDDQQRDHERPPAARLHV